MDVRCWVIRGTAGGKTARQRFVHAAQRLAARIGYPFHESAVAHVGQGPHAPNAECCTLRIVPFRIIENGTAFAIPYDAQLEAALAAEGITMPATEMVPASVWAAGVDDDGLV